MTIGNVTGYLCFAVAPPVLGCVLFRLDPRTRRIKASRILGYLVVMAVLIWGALQIVAHVASARVIWTEVLVVLWFTIAWRLGWAVWVRTIGVWGQRWVRWGRLQRRRGLKVPLRIRLIPFGRAFLTVGIFFPIFITMVITHRCKLADGDTPMTIFNTPFESIRIPTRDGLMVDGWFIPQEGAERTIVICHGAGANKGNFVWFLGPLLYHDYNIMFFDFRAHGGSDGRVTTYGILERNDVIAAVDWLERDRPAQSRIVVGLGSSQGSMALVLAAAEDARIDAIVLDSPFTSPSSLVRERTAIVPIIGPAAANYLLGLVSMQTGSNFFNPSALDAVRRMGNRPVMVIHGSDDILMPASHSQALYDAAGGPKEIWFGPGPHSNIITTEPSQYAERLFGFLNKSLGTPPSHARRSATRRRTATTTAPQN